MNKKNGMATVWTILITFLVMAGLAGGGYYYLSGKQKKDTDDLKNQISALTVQLETLKKAAPAATTTPTTTTSALKTYTNETYGYSFMYPGTFSLIDYLYSVSTGTKIEYGKIVVVDKKAIAENALKSESEISNPYFMVSVESDHLFGLSEISSDLTELGGTLTDVTVDGEKAWKIHYSKPNIMTETYETTIYVNHGANGYILSWKNSDSAGTHDSEVDAIVKSFKWL